MTYNLAFNFCGYTPNDYKCNGAQDFGTLTYGSSCASLTGATLSDTEASYYDTGNHTAGVILTYPQGESCPHSDADYYQLSVAVVCDEDVEGEPEVSIDTTSIMTPCTPMAVVRSKHGCPTLEVTPLFDWLYDARFVMGPIAGLLGIYFMISSLFFYKPTCYIIGVASTPVLLLGFLYGV